jgi:GNAT superfamily N-acetyltransferase
MARRCAYRSVMDRINSGVADPAADGSVSGVRVELYTGSREHLRPLFELAEDSATQLDSYLDAGRVLVAVSDDEVIGHLQLVDSDRRGVAEIKNMAVLEGRQGRGAGSRLMRAAIDLVAAEAGSTVLVATASADVGSLRFYQRQGFRMRSIERDAFTPATGYTPDIVVDGIGLRDRVWLDYQLDQGTETPRVTADRLAPVLRHRRPGRAHRAGRGPAHRRGQRGRPPPQGRPRGGHQPLRCQPRVELAGGGRASGRSRGVVRWGPIGWSRRQRWQSARKTSGRVLGRHAAAGWCGRLA